MIKRIAWAIVTAACALIALAAMRAQGAPTWALVPVAALAALVAVLHLVWPEESERRLAWLLAINDWLRGARR